MVRILQVGLAQNFGGIENCIMNYYRYLDKTQFSFDFIDIYGHGLAFSDEIMALGGKIHTLNYFKKSPIRMVLQLQNIMDQNQYDIIHINMMGAENLVSNAFLHCKSRPVVIAHSHTADPAPAPDKLREIWHRVSIILQRMVLVEKWACSVKAGRWMWGESFNTENVIPNAIDISRFHRDPMIRERLREECGFKRQDIIVGFVGRICKEKNVLFLPEILMQLRKFSSEYKMIIVGDGLLKASLMEKFRQLDLLQNVYFTGGVEDVSPWYSVMDAFVLPSVFEGLGIVGLEAQVSELPCFVSDVVPDELNVTNSVIYLTVQNGAAVWAEAIHKTLKNPLRNLCKFPEEYQIVYAVKRLEERYMQLADRRRKR